MKLYTFYFSPTGGTKKVLDIISAAWDCEKICADLSDFSFDLSKISLDKEDVCIVAVPSFSGRVPQFILPRLQNLSGNGTKAILITAYGNRAYDDTLLELKDTLDSAGFFCICAIAAVTQHSLMPDFGHGRPDSSDVAELRAYAEKCKSLTTHKTEKVHVPGSFPYRKYMSVPLKPAVRKKQCTKCGLCATKCPVQAILSQNPQTTNKQLCISCMQCVNVCPQQARYINGLMQQIAKVKMKKVCDGRKKNKLFYGKADL